MWIVFKDKNVKWYQKINPLFWFKYYFELSIYQAVASVVYNTYRYNVTELKKK